MTGSVAWASEGGAIGRSGWSCSSAIVLGGAVLVVLVVLVEVLVVLLEVVVVDVVVVVGASVVVVVGVVVAEAVVVVGASVVVTAASAVGSLASPQEVRATAAVKASTVGRPNRQPRGVLGRAHIVSIMS
jgi:hypothetical protein